jgi:hypothetical protein
MLSGAVPDLMGAVAAAIDAAKTHSIRLNLLLQSIQAATCHFSVLGGVVDG